MTMQLKGDPFQGMVSAKGIERLDQIAREAANRARCVEEAGMRIAAKNPSDKPWIVLHVWPGREQAVEMTLSENKIQAFVPICKGPKRRRHHKELPPSEKPVFMGYLFVRCHQSEHAIQGLTGFDHVRGVVGGWPIRLRLSDQNVQHFKDMAESGAYDWEVKGDVFPVGCRVRIKEGPFASFEGEVIAFGGSGKGCPVVELDIFGRKTPILTPLAMLHRL